MKRALLAVVTAAVAVLQGTAPTEARQTDALKYFKSYFLTGDFVVKGVGLNGSAGVGSIPVTAIDVPLASTDMDVVGAILYWQVVSNINTPDAGGVGATFRGAPLSSAEGIFAKGLGVGTPPCWSNGGGTGQNNGSKRTYTFRMDVLQFFDIDQITGKTNVVGNHAIQIPSSNSVEPLGASLVLLVRTANAPLRSVVVYDGAYSMDNVTEGMFQTIKGFYDAKPNSPARLAHIAGSGQLNKQENLRYNNGAVPLSTNPFTAAQLSQWDNPTFNVTIPVPATPGEVINQVTTSADHQGFSSFDCITWAAIVFSTEVEDGDGDGLLDVWEEVGNLEDPNGVDLPNLPAMGASPIDPDLFVELGYMHTPSAYKYSGVSKPAHSHLPTHETLKLIGDAFQAKGIQVHFDAGNGYPAGSADDYLVRDTSTVTGLARGGEFLDEAVTLCKRGATDPPWVCQFGYDPANAAPTPANDNVATPGTIGWKTGYRYVRDEVLSPPPLNPDGSFPCDVPSNRATLGGPDTTSANLACQRRFDEGRYNSFRYVFLAHQLGLAKADLPCLDGPSGSPSAVNPTTMQCTATNPLYHVPVTNSGIGDFPGADTLITLGGFVDEANLPIGTAFQQASTVMHEFGHFFERRHGGGAFEPNCKPTYLSVMNYLYQLRGLLDDDGEPHLDYSALDAPTVEEFNLDVNVGSPNYRLGWYAPLIGSYLDPALNPSATPSVAQRHCNGAVPNPAPGQTGFVSWVRVDAPLSNQDIDWNADGNPLNDAGTQQDVNYSGVYSDVPLETLAASDDWANVRLNQIGIRRNVGQVYVNPQGQFEVGPYSIATSRGDLGKGLLGKGLLGASDLDNSDSLGKGLLGKGLLGGNDFGKGLLGKGLLGKGLLGKGLLGGDAGRGDEGGGDSFQGNPHEGEINAEIAGDLARTPPNAFKACVSEETCQPSTAPRHDVQLSWRSPNTGGVLNYLVYRVPGEGLIVGQTWTLVATVPHVLGQRDYPADGAPPVVDASPLVDGAKYTYFAIADYGAFKSDPSRLAIITAFNDPLAAANKEYTMVANTTLTVNAAGGLLVGADDPDDLEGVLTAELVTPPSQGGSLTVNSNGSFTYTPPANFVGLVTFTFRVKSVIGAAVVYSLPATVTIHVNPPPIATFVGISNAPPPANKTFNAGSAIPMSWGYAVNGVLVSSAVISQTVKVTGPPPPGGGDPPVYTCNTTGPNPCTDPGGSYFKYSASSKQWSFNLQTKTPAGVKYLPGVYSVTVTTTTPYFVGSVPGTPISITLK